MKQSKGQRQSLIWELQQEQIRLENELVLKAKDSIEINRLNQVIQQIKDVEKLITELKARI